MAYEVRSSISRQKAEEFLERLATDDDFRANFEQNPRTVLFEWRIDVGPDTLPETVTLPSPDTINALREVASLWPESAGPFGFAILFVVFGAMPVVAGGSAAG